VDRAVRAAVVVTGDEVLLGRVQERNAAHLGAWLDAHGVALERTVVVGDDLPAIRDAVRGQLDAGVDLVVTSGGLGVTHDDVTMAAVAAAAGLPMRLDEAVLPLVRANASRLAATARIAPEVRDATERKQATLPAGALAIPPVGTAAGCQLPVGGTLVVVLPGPPSELARMWDDAVAREPLRGLLARAGGAPRRTLRAHGVIEAELVERLADAPQDLLARVRMGICARIGELEITLADAPGAAPGGARELAAVLRGALGPALFSEDGATVEEVVARLLTGRGQSLAVAESCTGGLLGGRLTGLAGASAWFPGGVVSYADEVKAGVLGVPAATLARWGAVSAQTAAAMAQGVRALVGADWALSVTGIAGPGGGTAAKPVGLVYIGCAGPGGTVTAEHRFRGDRAAVRERSVVAALHMLRVALLEAPAP
jgi:nicotinamide-nucleotide amidase